MRTKITIGVPDYNIAGTHATDLIETLKSQIGDWFETKDNGYGEPPEEEPELRTTIRPERTRGRNDADSKVTTTITITMLDYEIVDSDTPDLTEVLRSMVASWLQMTRPFADGLWNTDEDPEVNVEVRTIV